MSYKQLFDNERKKFAQLTSNLQLINKTFDYEGFETAIRRAVLDLTARTLKPKTGVSGKLVDALIDRDDNNSFINQISMYFECRSLSKTEFDNWHEIRCNEVLRKIQSYYTNSNGSDVCYGKAQKIVNITLKGCYCLGGADCRENYFEYCHMALDSFTLAWYNRNRKPKIQTKWSNLSIDEYKGIVAGIRQMDDPIFTDLTPLQKEFLIWPLEIMITTVKGVNDCFGGFVEGEHVATYFEQYGLTNDLLMANIILGLSAPEDLDEEFVEWLNKIPRKHNKSHSAEFLLNKYGKT